MATKKSTNKGINVNDLDIDAIDKKFEKLDRNTIAKMKGTGSELGRKKTAKKTTTTTKKVKKK